MGISKFWHISFHPSHQHLTPLSDRLVSPPHNITLRQTCKRCLTTFILSIMESTRLEERLLAPSFRKWLLKLELQTGNHPSQKIFDMWKLEALADAFYCALHSEHCQTSPSCLITRPPAQTARQLHYIRWYISHNRVDVFYGSQDYKIQPPRAATNIYTGVKR